MQEEYAAPDCDTSNSDLLVYYFFFVSIGRRRFKPTEPLEEPSDVSKVLNPNPHKDIKCMQYPFSETDSEIDGTEDCLVLHVYSPKVGKIYWEYQFETCIELIRKRNSYCRLKKVPRASI